jgi:excisionase family DNA binding protein
VALEGPLLAVRNDRAASGAESKLTDRLLLVEEAAERLAVTVDWLYRHAKTLPFTVRNGRRQIRFSERGIDRYIRERQGS